MDELLSGRLNFFSELLTCGQELWTWEFDPDLQLIQTNCPQSKSFGAYFSLSICHKQLSEHIKSEETAPLIMADEVGFSWIAAVEHTHEQITRIYMIGPCFTSDAFSQLLERKLSSKPDFGGAVHMFAEQASRLPIIPLTTWFQMGLMFHFTVTGEKITISDFAYPSELVDGSDKDDSKLQEPSGGTWLAEQDAMRMIEEGRLDYKAVMGQLSMAASFVVSTETPNPDRRLKNAVLSFITLCTRAAIRGGLDAETAYHLGNTYIDGVESAQTLSELMRLNSTMYDDFVMRVHKIKSAVGISAAVQSCCNYIEFHLSEQMTLAEIAKNTGYAELYLAQKFKCEIGLPVSKYIQLQRIEKAKRLLKSTSKTVLEISEELGFCNSSYFSKAFRDIVGVTPAQWRKSQ